MRKAANKEVGEYLESVGFKEVEPYTYSNQLCKVVITGGGYMVYFKSGSTMRSPSWDLYWLIGVLTYHKLIK